MYDRLLVHTLPAVPSAGAVPPSPPLLQAMLNKAVRLLAEHPRMAAKGLCVTAVCPGWCR